MFLRFNSVVGRFAAATVRWAKLIHGDSSQHRPNPLSEWLQGLPLPPPRPDAAADARAKELLLRMLTPAQRAQWEAHGFFLVDVPQRGTFCILPRTVFNVIRLDSGDCYCGVCETAVPLPDLMLAQKLVLENDPERFFSIAHHSDAPDFVPPIEEILAGRGVPATGHARLPRIRCSMLSAIPHATYLP